MRLVKVAKALGMTGQQLRHELENVDFGVKPTDREIPDNLAQGIVRFVARKHNLDVDMEALGFEIDEDERVDTATDEDDAETEDQQEEEHEQEVKKDVIDNKAGESLNLNVLRKLTLDNVPKEAIAEQKKKLEHKGEFSGKKHKGHADKEEFEEDKDLPPVKKKSTHTKQEQIKKKDGVVMLPEQVTVKEFAEKTGIQVPKLVAELMKNGVMATINQHVDYETAAIIATELGVDVQKEESAVDAEHLYSRNLEELLKDEPENLTPRAPIVVVMGHVDHGKTSILDAVRETDVVGGEAGGITQHIGAYQVVYKTGPDTHAITFLDTPGHEAFTAMRARGAQVTDIAIIVVAANEGIKPTTVEAIAHAKDAGVPIIVAINKMDVEGADPDKVKGDLAAEGLQSEDWGGSVPTVLCSAKTRQGITDILDHVVMLAELNNIKGNENRSAVATVVESHLDSSLGALATLVVNTGTLNVGDAFICGATSGKVRAMMDAHGKRLKKVGPSGAVQVSGFSDVPQVGDVLQIVPSEQKARELLSKISQIDESLKKRSFADLVSRLSEGKLTTLKVVLKADAHGSLEALQDALSKLATDEVSVKVIHGAIGAVSENDVMMAAASDGIVVAFHADVPGSVKRTAEREGVKVREYDIVYNLLDDIEGLLNGLVEPEEEEQILGHLEVREVFLTKKKEQIVGGRVTDGVIKRLTMRILRDGEQVGTGRITSLRFVDKDIKEAKEGTDCGMRVETNILVQENDVLEVYLQELKKKS